MVGGVNGVTDATKALSNTTGLGEALVVANRTGKGVDVEGLTRDLAELSLRDPRGAADAIEAARKDLSPVQQGELDRLLPDAISTQQRAGGTAPAGLTPAQKELALDLTQMGLDVAGLFDPTPISDGANGIISLFRGDWLGAGISAVSMIPYLGDAAKLGKLGHWGKTVVNAVEIARTDSAFAQAIRPALGKISDAIGAAPNAILDRLPQSARDTLSSMKRQIDELYSPAAKKVDDVAAAGVHTAHVGRNEVTWTIDANGRPTSASATLSEVQPTGTKRSSDELSAQDRVRERGLDDDDAGHIIGHRFMPDQGERNMFPQNFNFNRSAYKTMENEWAAWIEAGATVKVNVALKGGTADRPAQVGVVYEVFNEAGKRVFKNSELFDNAAGQTFDRVSTADIRKMLGK
ncbi:DNA/RNA non-specific endonuclease [Sphingomonas cannabina]|uniref:DNA/RNA non-specific endonuclease n=1 Tax=Sphingomonas cannabina TaxID=2899123 RepID=UPI001F3E2DB4|nr:DNA/RNA non-specific endonuclease [Sphingomonas cannabina]UIJ46496.1 DNA/RNA non-specific endonuclease [Sphingomonas cannabina]